VEEHRLGWALTGFLVGFGFGSLVGWLAIHLNNLLCHRLGCPMHGITLASLLPFAIMMGLAMAANMLHPPFGD
jgi:hypothetical protein